MSLLVGDAGFGPATPGLSSTLCVAGMWHIGTRKHMTMNPQNRTQQFDQSRSSGSVRLIETTIDFTRESVVEETESRQRVKPNLYP